MEPDDPIPAYPDGVYQQRGMTIAQLTATVEAIRETESNFSAVFPVWDLIFGTFRRDTRAPQENMELGLRGVRDGRANRLWWLLGSPILNSLGRDDTPAT